MSDSEYTTLLASIWIAPAMYADHRFGWYIGVLAVTVLLIVAQIKGYYERKMKRLQAAKGEAK